MCHGLTAFDGYQMANRKGRMEPGEARAWRWGRQKDGERSFVSLCGEMSRVKGAYLHMHVGAWTELNMYV